MINNMNKDIQKMFKEMNACWTIEKPKRIPGELYTAKELLRLNNRINDRIYFITIKKLKGSENFKTLKCNFKKCLSEISNTSVLTKLNWIFSVEIDEANSKDVRHVKKGIPLFHIHALISTSLSFKEVEKKIISKNLEMKENIPLPAKSVLDIQYSNVINTVFDTDNAIGYISKGVSGPEYNTYDFRIKH